MTSLFGVLEREDEFVRFVKFAVVDFEAGEDAEIRQEERQGVGGDAGETTAVYVDLAIGRGADGVG